MWREWPGGEEVKILCSSPLSETLFCFFAFKTFDIGNFCNLDLDYKLLLPIAQKKMVSCEFPGKIYIQYKMTR